MSLVMSKPGFGFLTRSDYWTINDTSSYPAVCKTVQDVYCSPTIVQSKNHFLVSKENIFISLSTLQLTFVMHIYVP